MKNLYDVVIVGAGPVGLFLACELGLARASVLVLEQDLKLESPFKDAPLGLRGMNTPSVESLYRRGLLGEFVDLDKRPSRLEKTPGFRQGGHFAGIGLNVNQLELDRWKYRLPGLGLIPLPTTLQQVETVLSKQAEKLGVTILRGHGVQKVAAQDNNSVTVEAGDRNQSFTGKWLVACDGGRSTIRKAAGFDFEGTEAKMTGYAVHCEFDHPGKVKPGFHPTENGMYVSIMQNSVHLSDFDDGAFDRTQTITVEHLQEVLNRVTGITDLKIEKIHHASSYTDRCKLATTYRKGRVLLAGDAAHIHSPLGAQGLNLGLGDAFNLGWKLAATLRQEASTDNAQANFDLLDTYETERHPLAEWALDWTRAQVSVLQPGPFGRANRRLIKDFIDTNDGTNLLLDRFWGLTLRYDLDAKDGKAIHPLVGSSVPDFEFEDGSHLGSKMAAGRGLIVDLQGDTALEDLASVEKYGARVDYLNLTAKDRRGIGAVIVRPDGIAAWAKEDDETLNIDAAKAAMDRWFAF